MSVAGLATLPIFGGIEALFLVTLLVAYCAFSSTVLAGPRGAQRREAPADDDFFKADGEGGEQGDDKVR